MSDGGLFKAEVIYISDCEKRGAGDMVQQETYTRTPPPINTQPENTVHHFVSGPATMETAVNKHQGISQQQWHNTPVGAEVSLDLFLNRESDSDERLSPTNSTDLFPASSKSQSQESILSESWDKDRSWSALQMSPETSCAVSPCSSVRSGMFTPSVVRVKRHSLEPGSSLVHMPPTCLSPTYCASPSSSPCPLSPRSRHRPPPTRLSLLTAILRKGRLPVLSPTLTLQRPYSPCWPIHHGTSCNACSAASSVASIPLEVHSEKLKSNNGIISERVTSPSYRSLVASPVPPLSQASSPPGIVNSSSNSTLDSLSPGPVNTSSNSTLDTLSAEPKPVSKNFVQALNSHLQSKLTFLSSAPANNQETFKALDTSTPEVSSMGTSNNRGISMGTLNTRGTARPQVWSPLPYSCLSRSPKPLSLSCCAPEGHLSASSHSPSGIVSSAQRYTDTISPTPLQNGLKTPPHSMLQLGVSPAHRAFHLTPTLYTSPGCPSPKPPTPPSTPDRFTLSPSPAPPTRDLTPSPSLSLRSTPSPCLWREMSDSIDTKRKPHKIKLSYKALAAIPTNIVLLDQQVSTMCSPAQLRKQSEDLYAAIDEVLEDPIPMVIRIICVSLSLGRETKYVSIHMYTYFQTLQTKPGVIRPANIIPRLPEENDDEAFHPNPFKQYLDELTVNDQNKNTCVENNCVYLMGLPDSFRVCILTST
uniref:Uncharacterized protein n=1 Tax=Oncorhynchus mykiss TaxID=8022 RepID=A0A8C7V3G1_ONCMY